MNTTFESTTLFPFQTNFSNSTDGQGGHERSEMEKKLKIAGLVFITLSFIGTFGNSISFIALVKSKKIRNATTAFIVNLCVADGLYCIGNLISFFHPELNRNSTFCHWFPMFRYWVAGESCYLLIGITINRYICVVFPKIYRSMYRPVPLGLQIAFTWLYALMLALLPFFKVWGRYGYDSNIGLCSVLKLNGRSAKNFFFISAFAFPATAFAICYPMIFRITRNATKRIRKFSIATSATLNGISDNGNRRSVDEKELRILKVMLVIVVSFIICYFPVAFIKLSESERRMPNFTIFAYFAVNLSNVINPILYIAMSSEYRKAYYELFQFKNYFALWSTSSNAELVRA